MKIVKLLHNIEDDYYGANFSPMLTIYLLFVLYKIAPITISVELSFTIIDVFLISCVIRTK